jgi:hypothetical protein
VLCAWLASAHAKAGRVESGLAMLAESLAAVDKTEPLIPNPQGEAEACFLKASHIACQQSAESGELRAT